MVNFFTGLFSCVCFFFVCYLFSLMICSGKFFSKRKHAAEQKQSDRVSAEETHEQAPQTITHLYKIVTPKRRKPRKTNVISLKGALMPAGTTVSYNGKLYTAKSEQKRRRAKTQPQTETVAKTRSTSVRRAKDPLKAIKTSPKKMRPAAVAEVRKR